jgi:hypothetical protein
MKFWLAEISAGDAIDFRCPLLEYGAFGSEDRTRANSG